MTSFLLITCLLIVANLSKINGSIVCSTSDDLLPNPFCCTSFYQCANGVPILTHCASIQEGDSVLVFDPNLKQCVNESDYHCRITVDQSTTTTTTTTTTTITTTSKPIQTPIPTIVTCNPGDDLLPNPADCNSFYQYANGVPVLFQCAANREGEPPLVFDPNLKQCVYQSDYSCYITSPSSTLPPTLSSTVPPTMSSTLSSTLPSTLPSTLAPTPPAVTCLPGDDLLPNPADCSSFYQCAHGVPILFQCAANREGEPPLVFDPNLKQCVYQSDYSCYITSPSSTLPPTLSSTVPPTMSSTLSSTLPSTLPSTLAPTPPAVTCLPGDDLLPNPADCSSFYQCAHGVPILFQCAANREGEPPLVFDPNLKQCVYQSDYSCYITSPSSTLPPTLSSTVPPTMSSTLPPPLPPVTCLPGKDLLPNPDDCSSFYQCANGVPVLFQCAANHVGEPPLNFDPKSNKCVYPHEYPCQCHKQSHSDNCFDTMLNSTSNCAYCFDCSFRKKGLVTCDSYDNLRKAGCEAFTYNGNVDVDSGSDSCFVLDPKRPINISVTFQIDKHPLDLYYLMDVSGSMHDDRDNLVLLSSDLIETLKSLTPDFQIGYGSFIDKPRAPFGNAARNDYSFRNNLQLTKQTDLFKSKVRDTIVPLPDAYDVPESHGDALAQVIECEDQIGWRQNTRRIVLLATDATFHIAGDGALGNIYAPYIDGCYLDSNGYYTQQLSMDFPSVQQLVTSYSKPQQTTTVIFATNTSTLSFYEQVASQFSSAHIAVLNSDSSNILNVVKNGYEKIQSEMKIEKSKTTNSIKFRYFSNCARDDSEVETIFCENLPPTGTVTFTVEVDLNKCPDNPNEIGTDFILNPVGLPIFVAVELIFMCP